MMKKLFLWALLAIFTLPMFAKHVDVENARTVARSFWEQNLGKQTRATFSDITSQTEFTNFYIFNTSGGFVIVSADDIAYPVLGYSDEGSFNTDNIGPNTLNWLRGYQLQIQFGIDNDIAATEEISNQWYKLQNGIRTPQRNTRSVSSLLATRWNQSAPYNNLCPYDNEANTRTVTGCVATAMAQVMKYWNYPARGIGSHTYTHSTYGELSADFGNTTYDWNNMLNSYRGSTTTEQDEAVAVLMYHCGVAVEMSYDIAANGGSGAYTVSYDGYFDYCAESALKNFFCYNSTTLQGLLRDDYEDTEWKNILRQELNASRPIIYSGSGDGGGHCFVCDGYDANDYFHFNWGWGGSEDGMFLIDALNPGEGGIGGGGYQFNEGQDIIIGIQPSGITVSPATLEIASAGGNYSGTVRAGTAAASWTATSSENWLTISPTTGAGSQETTPITITATENDGSSIRTATVTFNQGGTSTTTLIVTQIDAYTESCFTMHEDRFASPALYTAGSGFVCGTNSYGDLAKAELFEPADGNYDVTSIDFMYAVNGEEGSVTFKVWANDNGVPGGELASKTVTLSELYQAGTVSNSRRRGVYTWTLNPSVVVSGNFFAGVDISNATSGFGLYSTSSDDIYSDNNYELSSGGWTSMSSSWTDINISMYVLPTICPSSAPYVLLSVSPSSLSYRATGGSEEITVASNIEWTVTSSADWLTITPTSGSGDGTITVEAATNTSEGERTATITVSGEGATPKTINVNQADPNECFVLHEERFPSTPSLLSTGSGTGYVCGSNNYGDIAKAELFELANNYYNVTSIDFMYAVDGEEGSITFKVWANNDGVPGDELATNTVTLSDLYSAGTGSSTTKYGLYTWTLTTPVAVSGNFFAGIDVSEATSYIGLFSTTRGSGYTNSNYEIYNGRWVSMTSSWSGLDISMYVLPTVCPIPSYNITVLANNDTYGTVAGGGTYPEGTQVTISATPATGYNFINWTENSSVVSNNAEYSFAATANRTLVANFEAITYTITATANPTIGGIVSGAGTFEHGQTVTVTATANTGYTFTNWTENDEVVSTDEQYSFSATQNRNLVANFQIITYSISAISNPTEAGNITGDGEYPYGQTVTLNAIAAPGYSFINWTENDAVVSTDAEYSFTATASRTLVANFETITYTITAIANPVEGGTVSGADSFTYGASCTLTASANTGYQFVNWTGSDGSVVSSNASYSFTVTSNSTYQANFTKTTVTPLPWTENFDNGYSCAESAWVYLHGEWATPLRYEKAPNVTNYYWGAYSDPYCMELRASNSDNMVVLPQFDEPLNKLKVSFRIGRGSASTGYTVKLGYVTDPSDASTFIALNNIATPSSGLSHFDLYTYDLTQDNNSPSSSSYRLAIKYTMSGEDSWYLDDFDVRVPSYTITASANPAEGGNINGTGEYNHGETCTLTAIAEEGYHFVDWTENGTSVSSDAEYSFTATANRTLVANFEINTYTVTAIASPEVGGSVTIDVDSQNGVYNYGTNLVITATANEGYHFVRWNSGSTETQISYTVVDNAEFIAYFARDGVVEYVISATANPSDGGTILGTGIYEENTEVVLTATANTGYSFVNWTEGEEIVSTNAEYSFNVTADRTLVANFALNTYTISATANPTEGGTIEGAGEYTHGETATLRAIANTGYTFASWTDGDEVVSTDAEYSFTATADRTLVANFTINTYTISATANPTEGGTIEGARDYTYGETATLIATASEGYNFINWTEDGEVVSTEAEYSFTVTADRTLVANFTINTYTISATANPTEGGTIEGARDYTYGETATLTATASEGYNFINWTEDGEVVSTEAEYSFTVTADRTLVANFEAIPAITYTISVSIQGNGTVTFGENEIVELGTVTVEEGATPTFTFIPDEGYRLSSMQYGVDGGDIVYNATDEVIANNGVFTLEAVDDNMVMWVEFVPITSVDMLEAGSITVYPNPNNGKFILSMESIEGDVTCQIVNANGSVIETREMSATDGSEFVFDCNVAPGAYFVRVISGDRVWTESVVINR